MHVWHLPRDNFIKFYFGFEKILPLSHISVPNEKDKLSNKNLFGGLIW